jgi:alkanesulfonate monooxygenase SsuD/methylene tetrahydromethanopterin reductase-like flavin-dependent oxidoreductase (luciferase family)
MATKQEKKQIWQLTPAELAEITAQLNEEMVIDKSKPLGAAMKRAWERAKRKPGRPRVGKGARVISVSIEQTLLEKTDRLAARLGTSRGQLITAGLISVMTAAVGAKRPLRKKKSGK